MRPKRRIASRRAPLRVVAGLCMVALGASACGRLEPLSTEQALERLNVASTKLYAADGTLIANLHGEINRDIIPLDDIPQHVRDAVVSIEDARFWTHRGIDLKAILRAAVANVGSAGRDDDRLQGGSTLSQQLVKNLYFPRPDRTIERKLEEARVTWQFEQQYSKPKILEMYLNTIYFGRGTYGIQTAASSYFDKQAAELTLAEAAFLAGVIHEPGRYHYDDQDSPERREQRIGAGVERRNLVLGRMQELGMITEAEAAEGREADLAIQPRPEAQWRHPYFVDMVLKQLGVLRNSRSDALDPRYDLLGDSFEERSRNVYRGGLRIYTTLDPQVQEAAEEAVDKVVPASLERMSAALAAVEPKTGYIRAVVGGRNYYPNCGEIPEAEQTQECRFAKVNLALGEAGGGSGRQPGSAFKPFVLAAALERGVSLSSSYSGAPFTHTYRGGVWNVRNYEGSGGGGMSVVEATVSSVNAAYARLEIDGVGEGDALRGSARVADLARRVGIPFETKESVQARCGRDYGKTGACTAADDVPAIALGAKEVSPLDMASAYATFANDGVHVQPTSIARITDGAGRTLYEADPPRERVLSPAVARGVVHVLTQVIQRGTGTRARLDRVAFGKTGTSQQWRDAWFAGGVPQLVGAAWVGNPAELESMHPSNGYPFRVVGGSFPANIWQYFMTKALAGVPSEKFAAPPRSFFVPTSTPAPQVAVPDVLGMGRTAAIDELTLAGFRVGESTCLAPAAEEGIVVQQTPAGGIGAPQGSEVQICLSVRQLPFQSPGTDGQAPDFSGTGNVPNVVGESRAKAHSMLNQAGYDMASVRECDPGGTSSSGRVWKQDPAPGTSAASGSTVTIWYNPAAC